MKHEKAHSTGKRTALLAALGLLAVGASALGGCRGDTSDAPPRRFFPDMDYQPKIKPQSETEFFVNGSSQRPLVEGTVAYGATAHDPAVLEGNAWGAAYERVRESIHSDDPVFATGVVGESDGLPVYVERMPVEVTRELIERGQERFDIYCSACHGYDGAGGDSGTVGRLWSVPPANLAYGERFVDRSVESGTDGYLFHVTRNGLYTPEGAIRMPSYKHAVDEVDAWAIVAYLRVLQAAHAGDPADLDASVRSTLGAPPAAEAVEGDASEGGEG